MRDNSPWTLNCGLWGGVRVQVHASLLVAFVLMVYVATVVSRNRPLDDVSLYGPMAAAIWLVCVLLHELGHLVAAWRVGGSVDLIVIGPLGGMHPANVPRERSREITVAMAGPLANFIAMAILAPPLVLQGENLGNMFLHPLYPVALLAGGTGFVAVKMAFWFNWLLVIVNLIPAAPLDGGRALRSLLWPVAGYRTAMRAVSRTGMLMVLVLCLLALVLHDPHDDRAVPMWLPLVLLAIYLFFTSRHEALRIDEEDTDDDVFGYDFSQGYTSLERPAATSRRHQPGRLRRWLHQRRALRQRRLREIEVEEERRVDDVLIRVKEFGIDALSPEERSLLHRVSARYRNRSQS